MKTRTPTTDRIARVLGIDPGRASQLQRIMATTNVFSGRDVIASMEALSRVLGGFVDNLISDHVYVDSEFRYLVLLTVARDRYETPTVYFNTDTRNFGVGSVPTWAWSHRREYRLREEDWLTRGPMR